MTFNAHDVEQIRYRAAMGDSLCPNEHEVYKSDDGRTMGVRCAGVDLDTMDLGEPTTRDRSDDVRMFFASTLATHERNVAATLVTDLIDALRASTSMTLMTDDEHEFMRLTAETAVVGRRIIGDGPQAEFDWAELAHRVHGVQHMVLRQCAARAYPDRYRLLGQTIVPR